ncbi:type II secretion system secretin GspD [Endozoicomonas montiporae]|nr:type II secretion system secretin GspD [Endozoicomonas montiporae]
MGTGALRRALRPIAAGIMLSAGTLVINTTLAGQAFAGEYSVSFQNAKVDEFVNTVSANLNKTIIIDPSVQGTITVRSYETLNEEQYYQFFLSVLEVHGFAVVEQPSGILKVVRDKEAKTSAIRVIDSSEPGAGDEMISWVMPVKNVPVRELSPILRQLNDTAGNVVHYDPSNILLMTGRAANIERLVDIVTRIDNAGGKTVEIINLKHGSANEMSRILRALNTESGSKSNVSGNPAIVADEVGNRLIISGETSQVIRVKNLVSRLDAEQETTGNTRVFYLRYAVAEDLKEVLEGVGQTVIAEQTGSQNTTTAGTNFSINVHEQTNALVVTAQPDMMGVLESVIQQLDIRRAQVLVEAIIVEVADGDGINLSMQLGSEKGGLMQFQNGQTVPIGQIMYGMKQAEGEKGSTIIYEDGREVVNPDKPGDWSVLAQALSGVSGAAFTATAGDWTALLQAVSSTTESNVLATPSLMTLDNEEASFIVGDEVPTLTGATSSANNDNPFQTIERREVGIKLSIKPQVNEGDAVKLDIEQEVSNINGTTPVDITFATRQVKTSVMVGSGDTVVIGGLIDEQVQESESKVPLLGDIPFIGRLFRSTSNTVSKRNLMVFIRPTIIRDDHTLTEISGRKYGYMRARQLDRAQHGVDLMPNARIPVLSEDMSPQDILKETRRQMDEDNVIRQMRRLEEARQLIEQAEAEQLEKGEGDDAESNG